MIFNMVSNKQHSEAEHRHGTGRDGIGATATASARGDATQHGHGNSAQHTDTNNGTRTTIAPMLPRNQFLRLVWVFHVMDIDFVMGRRVGSTTTRNPNFHAVHEVGRPSKFAGFLSTIASLCRGCEVDGSNVAAVAASTLAASARASNAWTAPIHARSARLSTVLCARRNSWYHAEEAADASDA